MAVFLVFWVYFLFTINIIHPTLWILSLPLLTLIMAGLGLGFGIVISSLTTKYRDLQQLVGFGVSLLMYATPVIYPLSTVEGPWRWAILLNPMTPVVEVFRLAFLGTSVIAPAWLWYSGAFTLIMLMVGMLIFNRVESNFMDTV
jgi:lipopolysaccharide transport system permease protein